MKNKKILFLTDIHQNIEAVKSINFDLYDMILCGGDITAPGKTDFDIAYKIIDLLPERTIIIPGNCDKDQSITDYMEKKLNYIHKKIIQIDGINILGIGYSGNLKYDLREYRKFFLENQDRILSFNKLSNLNFLLKYCGIIIDKNNKINILSEEEGLELVKDYMQLFKYFDEKEIDDLFNGVDSLQNGIILTHSPPFSALDKLNGLPNIGSRSIYNGILKTKPKAVLCGHFHELAGKAEINGTVIFNPGAIKDNKYGLIEINGHNLNFEFKII